MPSNDVWDWLRNLERRDATVRGYMSAHRGLERGLPFARREDDLAPITLVGLIEVLVDENEEISRRLANLYAKSIDPPVLLVDKMPGDVGLRWTPGEVECGPSGVNIISADEWPKTERSLVECSKVIYFRDFLRSFWKRLTERLHV